MSRIRSRGNRDTELRMVELLRDHRITGWRRTCKLFGKPDFVFEREKVALFVDGCFWHGCPRPKHGPVPKRRAAWWSAKLARNKERDRIVTRTLRNAGWKVLRIWECDLVATRARRAIGRIEKILASNVTQHR